MNLEIVKDPVRKPRTGETAGDARDGAHIWTSEAMQKNYGETNPTLDDVESMEIKLQEIETKILDLFARGESIQKDIEKGKNTPGLPEDAKARAEAVLTKEKMDLGKQAEALEVEKKALGGQLERAKKFLGLNNSGLPSLEYSLQ